MLQTSQGFLRILNIYYSDFHLVTYHSENYLGVIHEVGMQIFWKTNISNPLIRTCTCAYYEVRNVSFSEDFAYVLNLWPLSHIISSALHDYYSWIGLYLSDFNRTWTYKYLVHKRTLNHWAILAKWLSIRLRFKCLWFWVPLQSLNLQISRLFWARSSLTFRQL